MAMKKDMGTKRVTVKAEVQFSYDIGDDATDVLAVSHAASHLEEELSEAIDNSQGMMVLGKTELVRIDPN